MDSGNRNIQIIAAVIGALGVVLAAIIGVMGMRSTRVADIGERISAAVQGRNSNIILPTQIMMSTIMPTEPPIPSPSPEPPKPKMISLSEDLLLEKTSAISFFSSPDEVVVKDKLYKATIKFVGNSKIAFKLNKEQKKLTLQCALLDSSGSSDFSLKVVGDGNTLLTQGYKKGNDPLSNEIEVSGVELLTFKTEGWTDLYCMKGELVN